MYYTGTDRDIHKNALVPVPLETAVNTFVPPKNSHGE
jgi:hypothetical protein